MARPFILPLSQCSDVDLTGGKAIGLAQLIAAGFSVPQGFCITTEAYIQCLFASGFIDNEEWLKAPHYLETSERRRWPTAGLASDR